MKYQKKAKIFINSFNTIVNSNSRIIEGFCNRNQQIILLFGHYEEKILSISTATVRLYY